MFKNKIIYLILGIYIILGIIMYSVLNNVFIFRSYPLIVKLLYIGSSLIVLQYIIYIFTKNRHLKVNNYFTLFSYAIFICISLYFRKSLNEETISESFYLDKWIKIIFSNKIVFMNIVYNILIFIPLGMLFRQYDMQIILKFILTFIIILLLETIQYVTKRGVFDYIDIILNITGALIGYIFTKKIQEGNENEKGSIK